MRQRFQGGSAAFLGRSHISPPSLPPFILHRGHSWSYSSIRTIRTNSLTGEQQAQGSGALGVLAGRCPLGLSLLHARSQHSTHLQQPQPPGPKPHLSYLSFPLLQLCLEDSQEIPQRQALPWANPWVSKQGGSTSPPEAAGEEDFLLCTCK